MGEEAATLAARNLETNLSPAKIDQLKQRLERSLRDAADAKVQLSRAEGAIRSIPHDMVIEGRVYELGRQLSRSVQ